MTPLQAFSLKLETVKFNDKSKACFENWKKSQCAKCPNCTIRAIPKGRVYNDKKNEYEAQFHVDIKCAIFNQFLSNHKGQDSIETNGELNEAPILYCMNCAPQKEE